MTSNFTTVNPSTPLRGGDEEAPSSVTRTRTSGIRDTLSKLVSVRYEPNTEDLSFLERAQIQSNKSNSVDVKVAVMSATESKRYFGRSVSRRGIQPVYIQITNRSHSPLLLDCVHLDPNYYPPLEAARMCHFWNLKQLIATFGVLLLLFSLPLLIFILPFKLLSARRANKRMDDFFFHQHFPIGKFIHANETVQGFVYCSLDDGTKAVKVKLLGQEEILEFDYTVPVPGIAVDYEGNSDFLTLYSPEELVECYNSFATLKKHLENQPRSTTNASSSREGDPANLVVIADFATILAVFGAQHWDETEIISLATCYKTAKSFVLGSHYPTSPVSALYMFGRSQDFALQKARSTINQRLHLRLWITPLRWEGGKPVWMGQISRDIGVKLAKTWNLTTHKIDENVDEARNYVISTLLESGYMDRAGLVGGVGVSTADRPRQNLGNDPYVTDGKRAVIILSPTKMQQHPAKLIKWE